MRNIQHLAAKESNLLQLVDVLIGAVRAEWSGELSDPVSSRGIAKAELARHIAAQACLPSLRVETPPNRNDFVLWPFTFSGKTKATP